MRHDIPDIGTMSEAHPHLIFHNFTSRLGQRVRCFGRYEAGFVFYWGWSGVLMGSQFWLWICLLFLNTKDDVAWESEDMIAGEESKVVVFSMVIMFVLANL